MVAASGGGVKTAAELRAFWRNPPADNAPETYAVHESRSQLVARLVERTVPKHARVLELGCNAGANLAALRDRGFENLEAVEINVAAVKLLRRVAPQLDDVTIYDTSIEDFTDWMGDYDLVYTLAVLEHVHPDSAFVFERVAAHTRFLLTVEDEQGESWRHFPRDYGQVFGALGMKETLTVMGLSKVGLDDGFVARLFKREDASE